MTCRLFRGNEVEIESDADCKKKVGKACLEYDFFQLVNHGVPLDLMNGALELSKTFMECQLKRSLKAAQLQHSFQLVMAGWRAFLATMSGK
ncbi:hypothetical protein RJ639_039691 [Escallonia herrerae]|uniref:Non-haem dioxygenase N-terminal domain-containing protein n=1 Tax=Escallonia herrerae TaxID=1293975 RepID=A0AA88X1F9_9ASTE|nr:hypothetical protein RJ639_039691 [Escallonia herrerae]